MKRAITFLFISAMANVCVAGTVLDIGIGINAQARYASGALSHVRHSAHSSEYIGCTYGAQGATASAYCVAHDDRGQWAVCFTDNPELMDVVLSLNSASNLQFQWNGSGACTHISVDNRSDYIN